MKTGNRWLFLALGLLALASSGWLNAQTEPATLILRNGKFVTVDPARPEAEALAVRGSRIVAIGSNADIQKLIGRDTQVLDLQGRLAIPGFIDSHGHFTGVGAARMNLNLMNIRNWDEALQLVAQAVKKSKPGDWIIGRGWHQEKWDRVPQPGVEGFPTHVSMSRVSPDNPVFLTHASGHASFANAKAMQLAGITRATANPSGGEILKDAAGEPIGVFRETASGLISRSLASMRARRTPEQVEADNRREVELAAEECLTKGVTSFHDAGVSFDTVDLYKKMAAEKKLGVRLWVMIGAGNESLSRRLKEYRTVNAYDNFLTVRAIKKSMDGALGPRGAWLLAPYSDLPASTGLNTTSIEEIAGAARLALENEYQLCVHAIGDRANRETLDIYEKAFQAHPGPKNLRWRIEHAQHLAAADIGRFGRLGVIAAMQGIHCTSDAPYVLQRLGPDRAAEGAYVWQKLRKTGAVVCNGTDAPVEDVDPIASFYASVSRRLKNGQLFYPDQRMSRVEALKSYTLDGAYAAFEEDLKGSLTPGKLADIVVLSRNILTVPEDEIPGTQVLYTIVGGKLAYSNK